MTTWPEPVQHVSRFLGEARAEARIEEFPEGTPTAADAARAVGCPPGHIVKSIVVDCEGQVVLAMVPGDRRCDLAKVAAAAGCRAARIAPAERVREVTGYEPGAVAPFPVPAGVRTLLHRGLMLVPTVWVGAGSTRHMAGLTPRELVRLTGADLLDIVAGD